MKTKVAFFVQRFFSNKWYNILFVCIYSVLGIFALMRLFADMLYGWRHVTYYDFLYNYGGGFIRRGLTGEIIFFFQLYLGIPPLVTICVSSLTAYILLSYILLRNFSQKEYSPIVLFMGFVLGSAVIYQFNIMRRDYIELALFTITLLAFNKLPISKWLMLGNLLMTFAIALHEATFLFSIPILIAISNTVYKNIWKSIFYWLSSIAMFSACCYFKGTPEMYNAIIERAASNVPSAFSDNANLYLLSFVNRSAIDTFRFHIETNFLSIQHIGFLSVPAFALTLLYCLFIPYMTIAILMVFTPSKISNISICNFISIILFQFACLWPMWTILSCDLARVAVYWIVSSLLVWLIIPEQLCSKMLLPSLNKMSLLISRCVSSRLPNKLTLIYIVLFVGIIDVSRNVFDIFHYSPIGHLLKELSAIYIVVVNHFPI